MADEVTTYETSNYEDYFEDVLISGHFPSCSSFRFYTDLIEFRIKIKCMSAFSLEPGERQTVFTWMKMSQSRSPSHSYYIKEGDKPLFKVINEGFVDPSFRGRVTIELLNPHDTTLVFPANHVVAFLLVSPYSVC